MVEGRDPHIVVLGILIIAFGIFIALLLLISSNFSPDNYFNIFLLSGIFGFFGLFVIVWFSKAFPAHEREEALSRGQALVSQLRANNVDAYYEDELVRIRGLSFDAVKMVHRSRGSMEQSAAPEEWYELDAFILIGPEKTSSLKKEQFRAKTKRKTKGVFRSKFLEFRWDGGHLADILNRDSKLMHMLSSMFKVEPFDVWIRLEAKKGRVRIVNTLHRPNPIVTKTDIDLFEIIADHIREIIKTTQIV